MMDVSMIDVNMLELARPWWFLVLPLPYLVYRFAPVYQTPNMAIKVPFFAVLVDLLGATPSAGATRLQAKRWQRIGLLLSWLMIVTALAQPMWLSPPQKRESSGRDIMIALDLSGSMDAQDSIDKKGQKQTRLKAAKQVLSAFSEQRQGDRLGLVLFGDAAYLQTPFTADSEVWLALLDETEVAMAGASTHLGDAIGLAIKIFSALPREQEKVLIVLTDGNDTGSLVPPIEAAKVAASKGVRIHVIAMGDPRTLGEEAMDMHVIESIASLSGGQYFRALSQDELAKVNQQLNELEPALYKSITFRPQTSMHHIPLILVMLFYFVGFSFSTLRHRYRLRVSDRKKGVEHV